MYEKDGLRIIERMLFQNTEVEMADFPPLDEYTMEGQETEAFLFDYFMSSKYIFAYVREYDISMHDKSWYIDIYIYSIDRNEKLERRHFVIKPGCQMKEKEEMEFLCCISSDYVFYNTRTCSCIVKQLSDLLPESCLKEYPNFGMVLAHVYFANLKGFREIIWKAGRLEDIAMNLHLIENWNLLGNNVEEAFDVPIKMLRKLNSVENVKEVLKDMSGRKKARNVYKQYHSILNNYEHLNQFQMRYLIDCYETGIDKEDVDRHMLRVLGKIQSGYVDEDEEYIDGSVIYYQYMDYISLVGDVKEYHHIFPKYPSLILENAQRFKEIYRFLKYFLENENMIEKMFLELSKKWWDTLYFESKEEQYVIIPARNVQDLLNEAQKQMNCLYDYIMEILEQQTVVVFMRDKREPLKSLITVEIRNGRIVQALLANNKPINDKSQLRFLWKYAIEKNLLAVF